MVKGSLIGSLVPDSWTNETSISSKAAPQKMASLGPQAMKMEGPAGVAAIASAPKASTTTGDSAIKLSKQLAETTEAFIASNTSTINLAAKMDKGDGTIMSAAKKLTIDKQGYAVNITLNVTMDADTVATTLLETQMIQGTGKVA